LALAYKWLTFALQFSVAIIYFTIKQSFTMNKADIEKRLHELNVKQSNIMSQKKANRNADELKAIREEMDSLKKQLKA
jgi:hypothetical protein